MVKNRTLLIVLLSMVALFSVSIAEAQTNFDGPNPASGTPPTFYGASVNAIVLQAQSAQNAAMCDVNSWAGNGSSHLSAGPTYAGVFSGEHKWTYSIACTHNTTGTDTLVTGGTAWSLENSCPDGSDPLTDGTCAEPAPSCDGSITGTAFTRFFSSDPGNICSEASQCVMEQSSITDIGGGDFMVEFTGTNQDCNTETEVTTTPADEQPNCISDGDITYCNDNNPETNCGYVNDQYLCVENIPPGGCTFYGNGDLACSSTAPSPPAPDDGITPGNVATPDGTITVDGETTNIYQGDTIINSTDASQGTEHESAPQDPQEIDFSEITETATEPTSEAEIDALSTNMEGEMGDIVTSLGDPEEFTAPGITLDDELVAAMNVGACSDLVLPFPGGGGTYTIGCSDLANLRAALGWLLNIMLGLFFFDRVTTRPT